MRRPYLCKKIFIPMKLALEEATAPDVTVAHPHHDPHGIADVLRALGIEAKNAAYCTGRNWGGQHGHQHAVLAPADGCLIAHVAMATPADYETVVTAAQTAFATTDDYDTVVKAA